MLFSALALSLVFSQADPNSVPLRLLSTPQAPSRCPSGLLAALPPPRPSWFAQATHLLVSCPQLVACSPAPLQLALAGASWRLRPADILLAGRDGGAVGGSARAQSPLPALLPASPPRRPGRTRQPAAVCPRDRRGKRFSAGELPPVAAPLPSQVHPRLLGACPRDCATAAAALLNPPLSSSRRFPIGTRCTQDRTPQMSW